MIYKKFVSQIGQDIRNLTYEAYVSAQPAPAGPHPWLSGPHEQQRRPKGSQTPPRQRPQTTDSLNSPAAPSAGTGSGEAGPPGSDSARGRARFRKADRIRRRREYLAAQGTGRRLWAPHFTVILAPPGGEPRPRLGLVVTRRLGKAVRRNRVKRLLREFFRRHREELPPQDIIILAKKGAETLTYADVTRELARILLGPRTQGA